MKASLLEGEHPVSLGAAVLASDPGVRNVRVFNKTVLVEAAGLHDACAEGELQGFREAVLEVLVGRGFEVDDDLRAASPNPPIRRSSGPSSVGQPWPPSPISSLPLKRGTRAASGPCRRELKEEYNLFDVFEQRIGSRASPSPLLFTPGGDQQGFRLACILINPSRMNVSCLERLLDVRSQTIFSRCCSVLQFLSFVHLPRSARFRSLWCV